MYKSLSRSKLRRDVIVYLMNNPGTPMYQMARELRSSHGNLKGVIIGEGSRYPRDRSLYSFDLIKGEVYSYRDGYSLSQRGHRVANWLMKEFDFGPPIKA